MTLTIQDIISFLQKLAPEELAEEWDNVGFLLGDPAEPVRGVLLALDVLPQTVEEAIHHQCNLIVSHHPVIFRPLRFLRADRWETASAYLCLRRGIAVYSMHTNLDACPGGVSDVLARALGLERVRILSPSRQKGFYKLSVFVPPEAVDRVLKGMAEAGAGRIGQYAYCSFRSSGVGTYLPLEGAQPYAGQIGRLEQAEESRLEMLVPVQHLNRVLSALRENHPYEEIAYDLYPLENRSLYAGLGRLGELSEPLGFQDFVARVKEALGVERVYAQGGSKVKIQKVAVCGGSGGDLIQEAAHQGADVFVTGEIRYHSRLLAHGLGLGIVEAGHAETERPILPVLAENLRSTYPSLPVRVSSF